MTTTIGVLALQGGVREHMTMLEGLGVRARAIRREGDLDGIDGLILPGGESGVIDRLARTFGLFDPIREAILNGLPTLGTCAGLILLARRIEGAAPGQQSFGALDVTVARNAFGSQRESFDAVVEVKGIGPVASSFIRAPIVTQVGDGVEVIARLDDGRIVGVRSGHVIGVSFHPEVAADPRLHEAFLAGIVSEHAGDPESR